MRVNDTLTTAGRFLQDRDGQQLILRGINLPLLDDWNFPAKDVLAEPMRTGANAIRIQWYVNYHNPARPKFSIDDLGAVLGQCGRPGIVPIVMLADLTCASDANQVNTTLIPWWTSPEVVAVLAAHQRYLVINIANEVGVYRWADDAEAALASYSRAYRSAIAQIRASGLTVPLMIDAPDCGTSLDAFLAVAQELMESDPNRNLLLSAHAYWAAYDGMSFIDACVAAELPIVFGEIANKQDDRRDGQTVFCFYDLDGSKIGPGKTNGFTYQSLLSVLLQQEIGWLAWSWGPDGCAARRISKNGTFDSLTEYGSDIVHNADYGLLATARRARLIY
jgi:mannan endo-1,4-beta-mannosidase